MMLSERRRPPITDFEPITETIGKSFTMSESGIRIHQQPSDRVQINQTFAKPLIIESNTDDNLIFMAVLSDLSGVPVPPNVARLCGNTSGNGDGGDLKRKRSGSSTEAAVEHTTFTGIYIPSKGKFIITVHAMKEDGENMVLVKTLQTDAFEVVEAT